MESRMKSLAGALMDCLVLPVQGRMEEWKRSTAAIDKEHAKEVKRFKLQIRKKSDQVTRLRKKCRKESPGPQGSSNPSHSRPTSADPSLKRLLDGSARELGSQLTGLKEAGRRGCRRALAEERSRYCALAGCLRPVVEEEVALWSELGQIDEVMGKMAALTNNSGASFPEACDQAIDDALNPSNASAPSNSGVDPLRPRSPSASSVASSSCGTDMSSSLLMGDRKDSMCSIASIASSSASTLNAPQQQQSAYRGPPHDTVSLSGSIRLAACNGGGSNQDISVASLPPGVGGASSSSSSARPSSAVERSSSLRRDPTQQQQHQVWQQQQHASRPHTISAAFSQQLQQQQQHRPALSPNTFVSPEQTGNCSSEPVSPSKRPPSLIEQGYSTIKRVYSNHRSSPFRRPSSTAGGGGGENGDTSSAYGNGSVAKRPPLPQRCASVDRSMPPQQQQQHQSRHFHRSSSQDGGGSRPGSAASNCSSLAALPDFLQGKQDMVLPQPIYMNTDSLVKKKELQLQEENEDDLKTPTVEELSFPGQKTAVPEDNSSNSSSGSVGSSSGYGSQNTIVRSFEENHAAAVAAAAAAQQQQQMRIQQQQQATVAPSQSRPEERHAGQHLRGGRLSPSPSLRHLAEAAEAASVASSRPSSYLRRSSTSASSSNSRPPPAPPTVPDYRRSSIRRSDSFTPGCPVPAPTAPPHLLRSVSASPAPATAAAAAPAPSSNSNSNVVTRPPPSTPPPPPIRRSSSISSNSGSIIGGSRTGNQQQQQQQQQSQDDEEEEEATPHGSVENLPHPPPTEVQHSLQEMADQASSVAESLRLLQHQQRSIPSGLSLMKRSTSMNYPGADVESSGIRGSAMSSSMTGGGGADSSRVQLVNSYLQSTGGQRSSVSFAPTATVLGTPTSEHQGGGDEYSRVGTRHVIPVKGAASPSSSSNKTRVVPISVSAMTYAGAPNADTQPSPEGEIYGFGRRFKEGSRDYFVGRGGNNHHQQQPAAAAAAAAAPKSSQLVSSVQEAQNRMFLESLSARLTAGMPPSASSLSSASSSSSGGNSSSSTLRRSAELSADWAQQQQQQQQHPYWQQQRGNY